ncbi:MAG: Pyridoxamine 5'-phosphate oxidase (EC [uncultured Campylobacterales bacterium]|uniref:Pyridoxamine 5'-phosphate oxidase n=1 Tax=uncultured Campylobacterales bacterium TaxID=352960 RepID=A0A6S6SML7_9BACT|nr:MAG: Pyridoxamine 5'-phosphate oxidase (EC [uncultured Campylobacterales bacterium]
MQLFDMRKKYDRFSLSLQELDKNPIKQFEVWFEEALACDEIPEANIMQVATVSNTGVPSIRTLLLKSYDENGFVFYTNYESEKAKHIEENMNVTLLFFWYGLQRQVEITGVAHKVSQEESSEYFKSRPRGSQLGAWVSKQSSIIKDRSVLENKLKELESKFEGESLPLPFFWGGYRVVPSKIEFWQGRDDRLHDRFEYTKNKNNNFDIHRLAP